MFRGLAAEHLVRVETTQSSQIGEVLAIILLNNTDLPEGAFTKAKLKLIPLAEPYRKEKEETVFIPSQDTDTDIQTGKRIETLLEDAKI